MRFSIIVPVYKVEKYLPECVESILNQNFDNFELILVDDGSPDGCPKMCDAYAERDSRIKVVHKQNGGLSDARNAGLEASKGEYVLFVDGDDFWHTSSVLEQISVFLNNNWAEIVQFGHEIYLHDEGRIIKGVERKNSDNNGKSFEVVIHNLICSGGLAISACSMAIKRDFLIKNNLFFVKGLKTEDLEWAIRVLLCEPTFCSIDEYFYAYRKNHGNTISSSVDYKHLCDYCWIIENSVTRVETSSETIRNSLMSYLMYHVLIASAFCYKARINRTQRKEILSRLKAVSKNRITQYTLDKKVKLAGIIYRFAGFKIMSMVLGFYLNNRGR